MLKNVKNRIRDEKQAAKYNLFTIPEKQEEQFSNDELDIGNNNSAELKLLMALRDSTTSVPKSSKRPQ